VHKRGNKGHHIAVPAAAMEFSKFQGFPLIYAIAKKYI
jgi:hypothetical protein